MSARVAFVVLACLLLLPFTGSLGATPEPPEGLKAGDDALKSKDWESAEHAYREALEEVSRCWKAREGLARTLAAKGDKPAALETWRRALLDADRAGTILAADRARLREARIALEKQDGSSRQLHRLVADATKDLVRFAGSKRKKTPAPSEAALRRALRLDPLCIDAHTALAKQGVLPSGEWLSQFHGTMSDWGGLNSSEWKMLDDTSLELDGRKSTYGASSDRKFTGDFDMRAEIRVLERAGAGWAAALRGAVRGPYDSIHFGISQGQIYLRHARWQEHHPEPIFNMPVERLDPPVDPAVFNLYELRFRGDKVSAFVNGNLVVSTRRSFNQHRGGIGVYCALARAVYRNIEVRQP